MREKACSLLGEARASVEQAEATYRRTEMPPPTRSKPFPEPAVIATAQALERLSREIGTLEGLIRAQPAPESDRMSELHRRETDVLNQLGACDHTLIGQAEVLRVKLAGQPAAEMVKNLPVMEDGVRAIEETLRQRRAILLAPD